MNNSVMYLIHWSQGPYYERSQGTIGVAHSEEEAHALAAECECRYWDERDAVAALDDLILAEHDAFEERDPRPESPAWKSAPRWPAGLGEKDITQEMREERNLIAAENEALRAAYEPLEKAWKERQKSAFQAVMDAHPELCDRGRVKTYEELRASRFPDYHPAKDEKDRREFHVTPIPVLTLETLDVLES